VALGGFEILFEDKNLNYLGYIKQEYDPATAMFLEYLRSGSADLLDFGLEMVQQYADHGLSPSGGSYQHRATKHAIVGALMRPLAEAVRGLWKSSGEPYPSEAQHLSWAQAHGVEDFMNQALADTATLEPVEREKHISELLAWEALYGWEESINDSPNHMNCLANLITPDGVTGLQSEESWPRDYAAIYFCSPFVDLLGTSPDDPNLEDLFEAAYAGHFARYGGGQQPMWTDFPLPLFYDTVHENLHHQGAHTLSEMLVYSYYLSGSPIFLQSALDSARFQATSDMSTLDKAAVDDQVTGAKPAKTRRYAWVLNNLVALDGLLAKRPLEGTENEGLQEAAKSHAAWLVEEIAAIPPSVHDGTISGGLSMSALAAYHHQTQDPAAWSALEALGTHSTTRRPVATPPGVTRAGSIPPTLPSKDATCHSGGPSFTRALSLIQDHLFVNHPSLHHKPPRPGPLVSKTSTLHAKGSLQV